MPIHQADNFFFYVGEKIAQLLVDRSIGRSDKCRKLILHDHIYLSGKEQESNC